MSPSYYHELPANSHSNKDKHPGIVDLSPQRRTQAQKKADDEKTMEEKQAQQTAHKAGIHQLAKVEEHTTEKLRVILALGPGPQVVVNKSSAVPYKAA